MQAVQPLFLLLSCRSMDRLLAELVILKNSKFLPGWLRAGAHETPLTPLRCHVAAIFLATSLGFCHILYSPTSWSNGKLHFP